jgi:hypothetical protein
MIPLNANLVVRCAVADIGSGWGGRGDRAGSAGTSPEVVDVIRHAQRLVDEPWPAIGRPLGWHVEAALVGDFTALAAAVLRARD